MFELLVLVYKLMLFIIQNIEVMVKQGDIIKEMVSDFIIQMFLYFICFEFLYLIIKVLFMFYWDYNLNCFFLNLSIFF